MAVYLILIPWRTVHLILKYVPKKGQMNCHVKWLFLSTDQCIYWQFKVDSLD